MNLSLQFSAAALGLAGLLLVSTPAVGQSPTKPTLAIAPVQVSHSEQTRITEAGKKLSLDRVVDALDGQFIDRFNATRKFEIIAQSDLKAIIEKQNFDLSGNVDPKTAALIGKLIGAKYLAVTTIDTFEDQTERRQNAVARSVTTKRTIYLKGVCKLYNTTTGQLLESVDNDIATNSIVETLQEVSNNAEATDELLRDATRGFASWSAARVADVIYPVKVLARTGKQVTLNRGDGTSLQVGQIWNANNAGKELKDPDTGEVLGCEEIPAGKICITEVDPKISKADVIEDQGVNVGAILRLNTNSPVTLMPPPPPTPPAPPILPAPPAPRAPAP